MLDLDAASGRPREAVEPSNQDLLDYALWLGMKLPEENDLLWIARDALTAVLPDHWKRFRSDEGELYYFNMATGESMWDHPFDDEFRKLYENEKRKLSIADEDMFPSVDQVIPAIPVPFPPHPRNGLHRHRSVGIEETEMKFGRATPGNLLRQGSADVAFEMQRSMAARIAEGASSGHGIHSLDQADGQQGGSKPLSGNLKHSGGSLQELSGQDGPSKGRQQKEFGSWSPELSESAHLLERRGGSGDLIIWARPSWPGMDSESSKAVSATVPPYTTMTQAAMDRLSKLEAMQSNSSRDSCQVNPGQFSDNQQAMSSPRAGADLMPAARMKQESLINDVRQLEMKEEHMQENSDGFERMNTSTSRRSDYSRHSHASKYSSHHHRNNNEEEEDARSFISQDDLMGAEKRQSPKQQVLLQHWNDNGLYQGRNDGKLLVRVKSMADEEEKMLEDARRALSVRVERIVQQEEKREVEAMVQQSREKIRMQIAEEERRVLQQERVEMLERVTDRVAEEEKLLVQVQRKKVEDMDEKVSEQISKEEAELLKEKRSEMEERVCRQVKEEELERRSVSHGRMRGGSCSNVDDYDCSDGRYLKRSQSRQTRDAKEQVEAEKKILEDMVTKRLENVRQELQEMEEREVQQMRAAMESRIRKTVAELEEWKEKMFEEGLRAVEQQWRKRLDDCMARLGECGLPADDLDEEEEEAMEKRIETDLYTEMEARYRNARRMTQIRLRRQIAIDRAAQVQELTHLFQEHIQKPLMAMFRRPADDSGGLEASLSESQLIALPAGLRQEGSSGSSSQIPSEGDGAAIDGSKARGLGGRQNGPSSPVVRPGQGTPMARKSSQTCRGCREGHKLQKQCLFCGSEPCRSGSSQAMAEKMMRCLDERQAVVSQAMADWKENFKALDRVQSSHEWMKRHNFLLEVRETLKHHTRQLAEDRRRVEAMARNSTDPELSETEHSSPSSDSWYLTNAARGRRYMRLASCHSRESSSSLLEFHLPAHSCPDSKAFQRRNSFHGCTPRLDRISKALSCLDEMESEHSNELLRFERQLSIPATAPGGGRVAGGCSRGQRTWQQPPPAAEQSSRQAMDAENGGSIYSWLRSSDQSLSCIHREGGDPLCSCRSRKNNTSELQSADVPSAANSKFRMWSVPADNESRESDGQPGMMRQQNADWLKRFHDDMLRAGMDGSNASELTFTGTVD